MTTQNRQCAYFVKFLLLPILLIGADAWFSPADHAAGAGEAAADKPTDADRTVVLRGKVVGPANRPLAGARMYLSLDEWTDPLELGATDGDGAYRFSVPEQKLRRELLPSFRFNDMQIALIAVAERLGPGWALVSAEKGGRMGAMRAEYVHDFRLAADFPISGRVIDNNGKPVAGVTVAVSAIHDLTDRRWYKMPTAIKANDPQLMTRAEVDPNNWFTPLYPTAWKMLEPVTTDVEGGFRLAGVGRDRAVQLTVQGPGIRETSICVITRDDAADFTQAVRDKYPRTPQPDGYFYPPREEDKRVDGGVRLFGPAPQIAVDPARTVVGVVRDASTGESLAGVTVKAVDMFGAGSARTDRHGRYRMLRAESQSSLTLYTQADPERYFSVVRQFADAQGLGEIVADFNIPRGVVIEGRVLESGTDKPIVSGRRHHCHDPVEGGPVVAGYITYFPLATNQALCGTSAGSYFEGFPKGSANYSLSAIVDGEGRFRLAVPPGPGVVLVRSQPGVPGGVEFGGTWKESEGVHRLFPYAPLDKRAAADGAPAGDAQEFPGLTGPIPLAKAGFVWRYEAYRVIDPPADAKTLDLTLSVPRAPTRRVRFVDPNGKAIEGLTVRGLVAPPQMLEVILDGSETDVLALAAGERREVTATSRDGLLVARFFVSTDDPPVRTIRLERVGTVTGRLVDATSGTALANYSATFFYPREKRAVDSPYPFKFGGHVSADTDGRFVIRLIPRLAASVSILEPKQNFYPGKNHEPEALKNFVMDPGEDRDFGDIRIQPKAAR